VIVFVARHRIITKIKREFRSGLARSGFVCYQPGQRTRFAASGLTSTARSASTQSAV
jgi:hypothetical protein